MQIFTTTAVAAGFCLALAGCGGGQSPGSNSGSDSVAGGSGSDSDSGQGSGTPNQSPGAPRSVSISPQQQGVLEGDSTGGVALFTVRLSEVATGAMSVDIGSAAGSATADDFTAPATSVTFANGEQEKQIAVQITPDTVLEAYETIGLTLENPSANLTITDATAYTSIANDDADAADPAAPECSNAAGASYQVQLNSVVDGENISFQVLEPNTCEAGSKHPLVLQGHGYSGSRSTTGFNDLRDIGYGVISLDQRGHGDSGGTIRTLDPDFAGQDLLRVLDWAEANLAWLEYRDPAGNVVDKSATNANLNLGAMGGSYGGGFQHLILAMDVKQRLDAMVPEITWHDLAYSLNPGNVVKGGWAVVLSGAGEAGTQGSTDPFVRATLADGAATNVFPEQALPFFHYHSLTYSCDNELGVQVGDQGTSAGYTTSPITGQAQPTAGGEYTVATPRSLPLPGIDILYFQGMRDTLFNMTEAHDNYQCMKDRGGDVRLYSYQSGHNILMPGPGAVSESISSQSGLPDSSCGSVGVGPARVAWFEEKMRGISGVDALLDPNGTGNKVCVSLKTDRGVLLPELPIGGTEFAVEVGGQPVPVAAAADVNLPLLTVSEAGQVLAGIGTLDITVSLPPGADALPLDSDAILFVGFARQSATDTQGTIALVDNQVQPIRGLGPHSIDMVAVGEELDVGDQLFLVLTQKNTQYPTFSRDPSTAILLVSGTLSAPLLTAADYSELD